jgi:hypothetical protein
MPCLAQRDLEADVAHDGGDDGIALSAGPPPSSACAHISITASPSTMLPLRVDEDRPVAVAVVGNAKV